jgi:hypothetical protein
MFCINILLDGHLIGEKMAAKRKTESGQQRDTGFGERGRGTTERFVPEAVPKGNVDFEKLAGHPGGRGGRPPGTVFFFMGWKAGRDPRASDPQPGHTEARPQESVDFDSTQNLFIEGDNLEVLKLLYKPYFGRVKMIYIDPPYNTGNDFVYPDNYARPAGHVFEAHRPKRF